MAIRRVVLLGLVVALSAAWSQAGELYTAATFGKLAEVKKILAEEPAQVQARAAFGATPLHGAVSGDHEDVVRELLRCGADVHARDDIGYEPIHKVHSEQVLDDLLAAGADINARTKMGETPLVLNVGEYMLSGRDLVTPLLKRGADPDARDDGGRNALHYIAEVYRYHTEIERERGAKMVGLLLASGTKIEAGDNAGETPLFKAVKQPSMDAFMADLLLKHGADVNARRKSGKTPLFVASTAGFAEMLLTAGADVNARSPEGITPVLWAAQSNADVLTVLLARGANIADVDNAGRGIIFYVMLGGWNPDVLAILARQPSLVNQRDLQGRTLLHFAAQYGFTEYIVNALALGVDPLLRDNDGHTPIEVARANGKEAAAALMELKLPGQAHTLPGGVLREGTAMVPTTPLAVWLGWRIDPRNPTDPLVLRHGDETLTFTVGSDQCQRLAGVIRLPLPAQVLAGEVYVPLRTLADCSGMQLTWDAARQEATMVNTQTGTALVMEMRTP